MKKAERLVNRPPPFEMGSAVARSKPPSKTRGRQPGGKRAGPTGGARASERKGPPAARGARPAGKAATRPTKSAKPPRKPAAAPAKGARPTGKAPRPKAAAAPTLGSAAERPAATPPQERPKRGPSARPAAAPRGLWLWGRHAVEAALANPRRSCHRLLATEEALARLGAGARRPGLEVATVEREEIDRRLPPGAIHQGLALSAAPLPRLELKRACAPEAGRNLVLVLDQVSDPHNVGAILRSAAAFEARAVVLPERRSAELGGVAARAAAGALDLVPVVEVGNLARALDDLAALGYWRLALAGEAEATIDHAPDAANLVLVLGAEGAGVRRLVAEHCDLAVRLPIAPAMESLNVSVACGIALYALAQRGGV
jgi:23S rRNA (guanosine2251-2'-O)-methyltransferase